MDISSFFASPDAMDAFNQVIQSTSNSISCTEGTNCKSTSDLEKKYEKAKKNIVTAPDKLLKAEKDYLIATKGQSGYNDFVQTKYTEKAKENITKLKKEMENTFNTLYELHDTLTNITLHGVNEQELLKEYETKNQTLRQQLGNHESDIVTNDRKTFYEEENVEILQSRYTTFLIIYCVLFVAFILYLFLGKGSSFYSFRFRIGILLFFILYPLFIDYIVFGFLRLVTRLYHALPKNVYDDPL